MMRSMRVEDYMTKNVLTLNPETEILRAIQMLIKHDISGAPVIDVHGRLVGLLTERDCMTVAMQADYYGVPGGLVKEYMSSNPHSVASGESILNLADLFIKGRFHRYPVLDNGRLTGIISRRDVMRAMGNYFPV